MKLPNLERLGLRPREQRLLSILIVIFGVFLLLGVPVFFEAMLRSRRVAVEEMRAALDSMQGARGKIRERQTKNEIISRRYQQRAPALAGFLEQAARAEKLEVLDSVDRPELPIGKRYVERNTVIHLKKSGMYFIAKFLERLEKSGVPLSVTRLNLRKRTGEPDSYDVEIGVSAYDRNVQSSFSGEHDKKTL